MSLIERKIKILTPIYNRKEKRAFERKTKIRGTKEQINNFIKQYNKVNIKKSEMEEDGLKNDSTNISDNIISIDSKMD